MLVCNAAIRANGRLMEIKAETFEHAWRGQRAGRLLMFTGGSSRNVGTRKRRGAIHRGDRRSKAGGEFGCVRHRQVCIRRPGPSDARDLEPRKIHVTYINIDGIDTPAVRKFLPDVKDEDLSGPAAIVETYWNLAHQRSELLDA